VKVGLFGGTFDPPHIGHLIAAQDAYRALRLDRLLFVPAGEPPHKRSGAITPAEVRLELLEAALRDDGRFDVCKLELERAGPSYTVDTLRALRTERPEWELYLLLGADQANELSSWREPAEVARLAQIVLLSRAGVDSVPTQQPWRVRPVNVLRIDVSASEIRGRVASGEPIRYLVPEAVETIVRQRGLYLPVAPNGDLRGGVAT
jgi:nicotinate-nucleotide adenylyltransferase